MVDRSDARAAPERHLGVFDAVCVVVGIVVGSLIFFLGPYLVAQNTTSPATMLLAWVFGGFLCLCGALSYAAYVAGEMREPKRNMLWVLLVSIAVLTAIYLAVNFACLRTLGFGGMTEGPAVAAETINRGLGSSGGRAITFLIAVSALGAESGCIFAGARHVRTRNRLQALAVPGALEWPSRHAGRRPGGSRRSSGRSAALLPGSPALFIILRLTVWLRLAPNGRGACGPGTLLSTVGPQCRRGRKRSPACWPTPVPRSQRPA